MRGGFDSERSWFYGACEPASMSAGDGRSGDKLSDGIFDRIFRGKAEDGISVFTGARIRDNDLLSLSGKAASFCHIGADALGKPALRRVHVALEVAHSRELGQSVESHDDVGLGGVVERHERVVSVRMDLFEKPLARCLAVFLGREFNEPDSFLDDVYGIAHGVVRELPFRQSDDGACVEHKVYFSYI